MCRWWLMTRTADGAGADTLLLLLLLLLLARPLHKRCLLLANY